MSDVTVRRIESHITAKDGTRLLRRSWVPDAPQRAVVLVHGFGEHSGRYDEMGDWLAQRA